MVYKSINFLIGLLITKINKIFQNGYLFNSNLIQPCVELSN